MRRVSHSKVPVVLVLTALTVAAARGEVATQQEATQVCQNWLTYATAQNGGWAKASQPEITGIQDIIANDGSTVLGRCFSIAPSGFVIVPILKELPPVKAYSDRCNLDVTQTGGIAQLVRELLEDRVRLFKERYGSLAAVQPARAEALFGQRHRQRWEQLLVSSDQFDPNLGRESEGTFAQAGPMLTSNWHQSSPYYNSCPYGDGDQTIVGCVATAASQLLRYHEWPPNGVGNHSYYWDGDDSCGASAPYPGAGIVSADFSDGYDWANMPDDCSGGCTATEEDALAELCYEVGVAYEMDYGACASGAFTMQAAVIFPRYFRYAPGIDVENRSDHTAATWFTTIQDEINAGRPMLYGISRHAIVCDGWRDTGGQDEYHMNYGWGGSQTAWFAIDDLHCTWEGCDPMVEKLARYIEPWQPADPDCNANTIPDYQDIWDGTSLDCNTNAIPDECDIADAASADCQPNGIPDECDIADLVVPETVPACDAAGDDGEAWCDDLESYALGTIFGNNWAGWGEDPGAMGTVTDDQNHTPGGSKSLEIAEHDTVRLFQGYDLSESSAWILSFWVYIPSSMTGTAHFILNPDYVDGGAGTTWAMNLEMNTAAGTINSNEAFASLPLATDAWAEILLEIDFAHDSVAIYYNDVFLARHTWTNGGGSLSLSAIDLWSPDSSGHYYDDLAFYATTGVDLNGNGTPDECEDCNDNGIADAEDIAGLTSSDCNGNNTPDECEVPPIDLSGADCNGNLVPDECEPDTDGDGLINDCETDDDNDGVLDEDDTLPLNPDVCEDVDGDGCDDCAIGTDDFGPMPDNDPTADGADGDGDGLCNVGDNCNLYNPDQLDCQPNGIGDVCDIAYCTVEAWCNDCNENNVPDGCDIAAGTSTDNNADGVPDECGANPPAAAPSPHDSPKNRYVSFDPNHPGTNVAFRIELTAGDYFPGSVGTGGWVGEPDGDAISRVVDTAYFSDAWPAVVHVGDCLIGPAATYAVTATTDAVNFSDPLTVTTISQPGVKYWADVVGDFSETWTAPNGIVNMSDLQAVLQSFSGAATAPPLTWADLDGEVPNAIVNMTDVQQAVGGFKGEPYPFSDPADCP